METHMVVGAAELDLITQVQLVNLVDLVKVDS
jgi:hypothetical protein